MFLYLYKALNCLDLTTGIYIKSSLHPNSIEGGLLPNDQWLLLLLLYAKLLLLQIAPNSYFVSSFPLVPVCSLHPWKHECIRVAPELPLSEISPLLMTLTTGKTVTLPELPDIVNPFAALSLELSFNLEWKVLPCPLAGGGCYIEAWYGPAGEPLAQY